MSTDFSATGPEGYLAGVDYPVLLKTLYDHDHGPALPRARAGI